MSSFCIHGSRLLLLVILSRFRFLYYGFSNKKVRTKIKTAVWPLSQRPVWRPPNCWEPTPSQVIKQRKQVIAVKCLFCKILERKCSQMKILKLLSFAKFNCASDGIFLKPLWSNLNYLQEKQASIWTKKSFDVEFLQFYE